MSAARDGDSYASRVVVRWMRGPTSLSWNIESWDKLRNAVGRIVAMYYFMRSLGRVRGRSFLMFKTSRISVTGSGTIRIGRRTVIGPGARIVVKDAVLRIGDDVFIGHNSTLIAFADIAIGDGALIGQNVSVHTENHGAAGERMKYSSAPITIGSGSWLAAGVVVTSGSKVGVGATVGANAVVTSDISANSTAVGVPARELSKKVKA